MKYQIIGVVNGWAIYVSFDVVGVPDQQIQDKIVL